MCKITLGHSQSKLERLLGGFVSSDAQVLLLVVDMQEITKKMVNHLRILVEEAERQSKTLQKLFVILLHFPPVNFFDPCYPSLFLQGWDHHYLDSIAHGTLTHCGLTANVVDVKFWFDRCVDQNLKADVNDRMTVTLESLVDESVPKVASRVSVILSGHDAYTGIQWSENIRKVLVSKGIGKVLAGMFRSYWEPTVMVNELKRVITFMYNHESTLNITDSIQSVFQTLFFDFLVYMVVLMNKDMSMQLLLKDDCSEQVEKLYCKLLGALPLPDLTHLKYLSTSFQLESHAPAQLYQPRFPFFNHVCEEIDKAIDESKEEVNEAMLTNTREDVDHLVGYADSSGSGHHSRRTREQLQEDEYLRVLMGKLESEEVHNNAPD